MAITDGEVFVNGESLHEPYVINGDSGSERPVVVPEEAYYVLGDNRRASQDSRDWGTVPAENIIGRGWLRYWPLDGAKSSAASALSSVRTESAASTLQTAAPSRFRRK